MKMPLRIAVPILVFASLFAGRLFGHEKRPLDERPEAIGKGEGMVRLIRESQFRKLLSSFDRKEFDNWCDKLSQVKPGMTVDDVMKKLAVNERPAAIGLGAGLIYNFVLDDAYMASGFFSYDGRMKEISKSPVAIIYEVYGDDEAIGQPASPK